MAAPSLDPASAEQKYDEQNDHDDEEEATGSIAVVMIPKARPRANAPQQQDDYHKMTTRMSNNSIYAPSSTPWVVNASLVK
jgi:hypothetical protein